MEQRDFKGVWIPKIVWLDERLNALEKVILIEIDSLDTEEKGCFASNEHLATFCQCSERKITESISKLTELGYIYLESFNGRKRVLKSNLQTCARQSSKNCEADFQKMRPNNIDDYNNLDYNNINNISKEKENIKEKSIKFQKPTIDELNDYIKEKGYHFKAENFINYYDSVGWKIGKSPMKDWKAACRTWESKYKENNKNNPYSSKKDEISKETSYEQIKGKNYW